MNVLVVVGVVPHLSIVSIVEVSQVRVSLVILVPLFILYQDVKLYQYCIFIDSISIIFPCSKLSYFIRI